MASENTVYRKHKDASSKQDFSDLRHVELLQPTSIFANQNRPISDYKDARKKVSDFQLGSRTKITGSAASKSNGNIGSTIHINRDSKVQINPVVFSDGVEEPVVLSNDVKSPGINA